MTILDDVAVARLEAEYQALKGQTDALYDEYEELTERKIELAGLISANNHALQKMYDKLCESRFDPALNGGTRRRTADGAMAKGQNEGRT